MNLFYLIKGPSHYLRFFKIMLIILLQISKLIII